jgi:hypothetical protein
LPAGPVSPAVLTGDTSVPAVLAKKGRVKVSGGVYDLRPAT